MKIIYDLFPAHFTVAPPGIYVDVHEMVANSPKPGAFFVQTTRVLVTETHITVAQDSPEGAQIVFNERYSFFEKSEKPELESYLITESGKMAAFKKDTNCGCGSRLRSWNPYRTLGSIYDPSN
jgi:hypothetical protein